MYYSILTNRNNYHKNHKNVIFSIQFCQSSCLKLSDLSPYTFDLDLETVATISELPFPESELVGIS